MNEVVQRTAARLLVLDANEHVLLLHTRDLSSDSFGDAWELPGGGFESGESFFEAAARELHEETGLRLDAGSVTAPTWHRNVLYSYRGERRLQYESIAVARFNLLTPPIEMSSRIVFEAEDHFEYRWWRQHDILVSDERFFPRSLPMNLLRLLSGTNITEPLEVWT